MCPDVLACITTFVRDMFNGGFKARLADSIIRFCHKNDIWCNIVTQSEQLGNPQNRNLPMTQNNKVDDQMVST